MPENNNIQELLQKLAPCIESGDLDACVERGAGMAKEMGIDAEEFMDLSYAAGTKGRHDYAYVFALVAAQGLEGNKKAGAYSNAGLAAYYLGKVEKAEQQYIKAIAENPNLAEAHYNYANLLSELDRKEEAEQQYKQAIKADSKLASAHYNYANLLKEFNRKKEAEEQLRQAIEVDPKDASIHSNYANLLKELKRNEEAEKQYKLAIEADPKYANAHGAYGLLLIDLDRRDEAWKETEKASYIFEEAGQITQSCLAKALFFERYSEKYFNKRKFLKSGENAEKAGYEYLKAAETVDAPSKNNFLLQGNILIAKSYVRKVPKKYWYTKILSRFGSRRDISGIINNLKQAASYYEKAAQCPVDEKNNVCNACHTSISVFSDTLSAMEAFIKHESPEINKKEWIIKLNSARLVYEEKNMDNGVALVDTLIQLIKCMDELAAYRESGLGIQKEKCGKCYNRLAEVSENLDGALNVLAEHSIEVIQEYAKKQGMSFIKEETKKSFSNNWFIKVIIGALGTIILGIIASLLYEWKLHMKLWNLIINQTSP